jgi:hypothetical protein
MWRVAAQPELVDLVRRGTGGDRGIGPVGRPQRPREDDLAPGVQDVGERMVGGRGHDPGDALVGGAAHDVRVRALEKVELHGVIGLTVFGQVEAELLVLGALVGEKAVERVVEHRRYQLPHDQTSLAAASVACRWSLRHHCRPYVIGAPSTCRLRGRPRALPVWIDARAACARHRLPGGGTPSRSQSRFSVISWTGSEARCPATSSTLTMQPGTFAASHSPWAGGTSTSVAP